MKKLVATILTLMLIVCLVGCHSDRDIYADMPNNGVTKTDNIHIEFWTDEETGVQYVIYDRVGGYAGMGGITPRLNSDGSVYIED
jgi:hypothetical protein